MRRSRRSRRSASVGSAGGRPGGTSRSPRDGWIWLMSAPDRYEVQGTEYETRRSAARLLSSFVLCTLSFGLVLGGYGVGAPGGGLRRHLGVWQATALNVTMVVGAGVFITVPLMLLPLPGPYA